MIKCKISKPMKKEINFVKGYSVLIGGVFYNVVNSLNKCKERELTAYRDDKNECIYYHGEEKK